MNFIAMNGIHMLVGLLVLPSGIFFLSSWSLTSSYWMAPGLLLTLNILWMSLLAWDFSAFHSPSVSVDPLHHFYSWGMWIIIGLLVCVLYPPSHNMMRRLKRRLNESKWAIYLNPRYERYSFILAYSTATAIVSVALGGNMNHSNVSSVDSMNLCLLIVLIGIPLIWYVCHSMLVAYLKFTIIDNLVSQYPHRVGSSPPPSRHGDFPFLVECRHHLVPPLVNLVLEYCGHRYTDIDVRDLLSNPHNIDYGSNIETILTRLLMHLWIDISPCRGVRPRVGGPIIRFGGDPSSLMIRIPVRFRMPTTQPRNYPLLFYELDQTEENDFPRLWQHILLLFGIPIPFSSDPRWKELENHLENYPQTLQSEGLHSMLSLPMEYSAIRSYFHTHRMAMESKIRSRPIPHYEDDSYGMDIPIHDYGEEYPTNHRRYPDGIRLLTLTPALIGGWDGFSPFRIGLKYVSWEYRPTQYG